MVMHDGEEGETGQSLREHYTLHYRAAFQEEIMNLHFHFIAKQQEPVKKISANNNII